MLQSRHDFADTLIEIYDTGKLSSVSITSDELYILVTSQETTCSQRCQSDSHVKITVLMVQYFFREKNYNGFENLSSYTLITAPFVEQSL